MRGEEREREEETRDEDRIGYESRGEDREGEIR